MELNGAINEMYAGRERMSVKTGRSRCDAGGFFYSVSGME